MPASLGPGLRTVSGAKRRRGGILPSRIHLCRCRYTPQKSTSRRAQERPSSASSGAVAQDPNCATFARAISGPCLVARMGARSRRSRSPQVSGGCKFALRRPRLDPLLKNAPIRSDSDHGDVAQKASKTCHFVPLFRGPVSGESGILPRPISAPSCFAVQCGACASGLTPFAAPPKPNGRGLNSPTMLTSLSGTILSSRPSVQ